MKKTTAIKSALVLSTALTLCSSSNARDTNSIAAHYSDNYSDANFNDNDQDLSPNNHRLDREFPILSSQEDREFELKMKAAFMAMADDPEVLKKISLVIALAAEKQNREMGILGHSGAICCIMAKSAAHGCSKSWNFLWPLIKKTGIITGQMIAEQFVSYDLEYYQDDANLDDDRNTLD
jgi:hypothetical protein